MYIYPNMELRILHNINLNHDYDHTILFPSLARQTEYFNLSQKVKYRLTNQMYQRKERGWIQVNINQNDLWDCTYLCYKNSSYGNKWFYAFILSVDYVNDSVSKINFEIDVLQTWHFDYQLDKCFVEREHSATDELFENTVPEEVECGEFYNVQVVREYPFNATLVAAAVTEDPSGVAITPHAYKNMFSGLFYEPGSVSDDPTSQYSIYQLLKGYISRGKEDAVIQILQYPAIIHNPNFAYSEQDGYGGGYGKENYNFNAYNFSNVDGYTPKNKKLFCYPYNYLNISDKEGNSKDLKWELWSYSHIGEFLVEGSMIGKVTMTITPKYYRDIAIDRDNSLTHDNFPTCTWSGDSFQVWMAQNRNKLQNFASEAIGSGATIRYPAQVVPVAMGVFNRVRGTIASLRDVMNIPDKAHGETTTDITNIQNGSSGFEIKQMTVKNEYAKIIDEYFSRFGYACHRIKVPNRNARQYWTFTKTIGCEINANIPSDDLSKIKSIYDNGITFWNDGENIGNYGDFTNPVYSS